ncbi:MAG: regulatory protein RecX [Deltaproteobacteria bacterium]
MTESRPGSQEALSTALRYLSTRPRSVFEVRERLSKKGFSPADIEKTIDSLTLAGYLDDTKFGRMLSASRLRHKNWGLLKIRNELKMKGVSVEIIEDVLGADAKESEAGAAREALEKWSRRNRIKPPIDRIAAGRAFRFLQSRGFSSGVALSTIKGIGSVSQEDLTD